MSSTEHEISVAGGGSWGTPGNDGALGLLGNTSQETCFLRGVTGDLRGLASLSASAEVYPDQGKWWIRTRAGTGTGVMAHVQCVNVPYDTAGGIQVTWSDGDVPKTVSTAGGRQCYLSRVKSTVGMGSATSRLTVTKGASSWILDGILTGSGTGRGSATMVCFNAPPLTSTYNYTWTGPTPFGMSEEVMRTSYPTGAALTSPEIACGLVEINHAWPNQPISFGWNDGVVASKNASPVYWKMSASNGKGGKFRCIK